MQNKQIEDYLERRRKLMDSMAEVISNHVKAHGYTTVSQSTWDEFSKFYRDNHCTPAKPVMIVRDEFNQKKAIKDFDINTLDTLFGVANDKKG